jgi:hypothetical protein
LFTSDISDIARPIAIDGNQALIERGSQREAIFWMVATYSRCQKVMCQDAPLELQERYHRGYWDLLADLGITSPADLQQRGEQVKEFLPRGQVQPRGLGPIPRASPPGTPIRLVPLLSNFGTSFILILSVIAVIAVITPGFP